MQERYEVHWRGRNESFATEVAGIRNHSSRAEAWDHFDALCCQFPLYQLALLWVLDEDTKIRLMEYHGPKLEEATQSMDALDRMLAFTACQSLRGCRWVNDTADAPLAR